MRDEIWNGVSANVWSQEQTLKPRYTGEIKQGQMYTGYELLGLHWSDLVPELPLDVRYRSFCRRLSKATREKK